MSSRRPVTTDADGRPVRPALTREFIVRTALDILDRDGVDGLTMRKLGERLGTNPMAFYHHLPNKAAVYDGVVEAIHHEVHAGLDSLDTEGAWRDRMVMLMRQIRAVLLRHPNVLPIVATRPAYTEPVLAFGDRVLGLLQGGGYTDHELLVMVSGLRAYTIGHLFAEVGQPVGGPTASPEEAMALMARYPNLARAVAGGYDPDWQFELGLQSMLDGFERRLRKSVKRGRRA